MFQENKLYKNRNCFDIVFHVEKIERRISENSGIDDYILTGKWLNRHYSLMFICDETIVIPATKLDHWVEFNQSNENQRR